MKERLEMTNYIVREFDLNNFIQVELIRLTINS